MFILVNCCSVQFLDLSDRASQPKRRMSQQLRPGLNFFAQQQVAAKRISQKNSGTTVTTTNYFTQNCVTCSQKTGILKMGRLFLSINRFGEDHSFNTRIWRNAGLGEFQTPTTTIDRERLSGIVALKSRWSLSGHIFQHR